MIYRVLGRTGLSVSAVGLGAGPVPALMTGDDGAAQLAVLARALAVGINWIDTAAGYGDGRSEASLGRALRELKATPHVATKVRLTPDELADAEAAVRRSLEGSLQRLGLSSVTLLQLHNGITSERGEIAASLTPADARIVLQAMRKMQSEGLTRFVGLTGTGSAAALGEVVDSGEFDTLQIPHHMLDPADADLLAKCEAQNLGVFAIRVYGGGSLLGLPPSAHTLRTPYFPLAVYEEERRRAAALGRPLKELALRFALSRQTPQVALIGMSEPRHVDEAAASADLDPLPAE